MESRVTITRDGEINVSIIGVNQPQPIAGVVTNLQPIEGAALVAPKRRSYKRKKNGRKNRRK
jgi:hypothetical protein